MESIDHALKTGFRALYPEHARALDRATTQEEIDRLHAELLAGCRRELEAALAAANADASAAASGATLLLRNDKFQRLTHVRGEFIKTELLTLIDGLQQLKGKESAPAAAIAAILVSLGVLSFAVPSTPSAPAVIEALAAGAAEAEAATAGVAAVSTAVVCAVVAVVIVAILIPIIYFMTKPASCVVLLINELDLPLVFREHHNVHGKPTLMSTPIPAAAAVPARGTFASAGFIATEKHSGATVGTQYGFVMTYGATRLAFGVDCPLTGLYGDNNCYCAFGESAESAARNTDKHNKQSYEAADGALRLSIHCHSGSGSIAYYVARAYRA